MNQGYNPYSTISPKTWGLYHKSTSNPVPLKSLDISINIVHNVAQVFYTQQYYNDSTALLETEFFFPISPDACFDSFQASFNNTTIVGVVKQKQQAQEEYKQALQTGRTAAYSEINEETGDIMKVLIGNIPSQCLISVTYSYIEKLNANLNKFWCFRLFSSITPRYNGNLSDLLKHDVSLLANYPTISTHSGNAYPWHIKVEIQSPSAISTVKSPSHSIVSEYGNENHTCTIALDERTSNQAPNKDFVLLFSNDKDDKIDCVMTPFEDGYCAMVSVLADFDTIENEQAYENFVKAKEVKQQHLMTQMRGEYIFLIDRSGSMAGDRIDMAKSSLSLFLRSLPKDSYFNVVSFGSHYDFMHKESSQGSSQESLNSACKRVEGFGADMGGTEIYSCLQAVFTQRLKPGYPRFIFLLTDGAVSNTHQVVDLIKTNNDKAQVFTVGLGNGCSAELITKAALHGRGKHEFVVNNKEIHEKVISLLNSSLSPCLSEFSFHADNFDAVTKSVTPNPASVAFLLNGQTATFFLFLRKDAFINDAGVMALKLRMYDSRSVNYRTVDLRLSEADALENDLISKLGLFSTIQSVEAEKQNISQGEQSVLWMEKAEMKKTLVELSVKYGILCKETAFICEVTQGEKKRDEAVERIKVTVPAVSSSSYSASSPLFRMSCAPSFGPSVNSSNYKACSAYSPTIGCAFPSSRKTTNTGWSAAGYTDSGRPITSSIQLNSVPKEPVNQAIQARPSSAQSNSMFGSGSNFSYASCEQSKKSEPGILSNMVGGITSSIGSLFSSKKAATKKMNDEVGCSVSSYLPPTDILPSNAPAQLGRQSQAPSESFSFSKQSTAGSSYLDVATKQNFEGCWNHNDKKLISLITKASILQQIPEEIRKTPHSSIEAIWMTILVLLWLETACKDDKKAWLLIHQKGCEWAQGTRS